MQASRTLSLLPILLMAAAARLPGAAAGWVTVSPGREDGVALVDSRCPTFSWSTVGSATRIDLAVYRLTEHDGTDVEPLYTVALPEGATSWTPSLEACLEPGQRYAWLLRAPAGDEGDESEERWSTPRLFEISGRPSAAEVEQALRVLQRFLAEGGEPAPGMAGLETGSARSAGTAAGAAGSIPPAALQALTAAMRAEVAAVTGATAGVVGVSHSPDGFGVVADNDGGGADLLLGAENPDESAKLTESVLERVSESDLGFDFRNAGTGGMTLSVDGIEVLTAASHGAQACPAGQCVTGLDGASQLVCGPCNPALCGDGVVTLPGEACDDGNGLNTDACLVSCVEASCGDGFVFASVEGCDDGNASDTDGCPTTCEPATCGDGFVFASVEGCDDGNGTDTDACPTTCEPAACGDGFLQAGVEQCDDGNTQDGDNCSSACTIEADGSMEHPALSCKQLHADYPAFTDGVYWIDPNETGPVEAQCDMTRDGGGWTLGVKSWYEAGHQGNTDAVGAVADALTLKGNAYKLADAIIQGVIGPAGTFDVLADQAGYNSTYSTGNYEYVVLRNYTGTWAWNGNLAESTTTTTLQSYRLSDDLLLWTGELSCAAAGGGFGINCAILVSATSPGGGSGCAVALGTETLADWHHFYMAAANTDSYLYICNGAQHSSSHAMNHRFWFREH
jgi:cysteine-rich repeat protein